MKDEIGPIDLDIVRNTLVKVGFRGAGGEGTDGNQEDSDVLGVMDVRFSPFGVWYEVSSWWEGRFLERTVRGAFKRTINQHNDPNSTHNIKTLFNHGHDFHIGDKLLGDIGKLSEGADSPLSEVNLWDTSYNRDLLPGLKRGSYGASFMFRVTKEEWNNEPEPSDYNPEGLPERTIKETSTFEAGPVTWPASPAATAGMRCVSATDAYYESLARRDPDRVTRMRDRVIALRKSSGLAVGAPSPVLVSDEPVDSAPGRSMGMTADVRKRRLTLIDLGRR